MATSTEENKIKNIVFYKCQLRDKACTNLYLDTQTSDVNFVICETIEKDIFKTKADELKAKPATTDKKVIEEIPAHKIIMAAASEVFEKMFYGKMKEKGNVEIVDSSPEAFKLFLQCFYFIEVQFTKEYIPEVMYLADKYVTTECMNSCVSFLKDTLTSEDICWGYRLAVLYKQSELKLFCEHHIALNSVQVFGSDDFLHCDRSVLTHILKNDLMPCEETILFDSCLAWAKTVCKEKGLDAEKSQNLRAQLGDCLHLIRLGTFSMEEFTKRTLTYYDLFTVIEWADIVHSLTIKEYVPRHFSREKRFWWNASKMWKCARTATNSAAYYIEKSCEIMHVTTNKNILLGGFYGVALAHRNGISFHKDANITITEIPGTSFDRKTGKMVFSGTMNFVNGTIPYVKLPIAIHIKRCNTYEFRLDMPNFNDCYVSYEYNKKVAGSSDLSIEFTFDEGRGRLITCLEINSI
ncbi:BTB/POZ domain-containing protein 6-B-like [Contarinia nasturtii]|uniref:BTB/POZ domain-containing protein 6-B-like n=1 Tax=Contarinia nasturtii TaxID=265458 RepID=UPI0012D462AC|nr:BTB/POZ domain-containing protein 6-B-like [Contarinia nasturtii]